MIEVGDHVVVGNGKVHWVVENDPCWTFDNPLRSGGQSTTLLRSPMSGRTQSVPTNRLTLHSKGAA